MLKINNIKFHIILLAGLLGACQTSLGDGFLISTGSSRAEVKEQLGDPVRVGEFNLPDVPFFGPQEILTDLIPAGTNVEEWVYIQDKEELYIWFVGAQGGSMDQWQVIATGRYPVGAVY